MLCRAAPFCRRPPAGPPCSSGGSCHAWACVWPFPGCIAGPEPPQARPDARPPRGEVSNPAAPTARRQGRQRRGGAGSGPVHHGLPGKLQSPAQLIILVQGKRHPAVTVSAAERTWMCPFPAARSAARGGRHQTARVPGPGTNLLAAPPGPKVHGIESLVWLQGRAAALHRQGSSMAYAVKSGRRTPPRKLLSSVGPTGCRAPDGADWCPDRLRYVPGSLAPA